MKSQSEYADICATDVRLAGDILRVVHGGLPKLKSGNAADALAELRCDHEPFRQYLNTPPIGNSDINSCLLYPPLEGYGVGTLFLASRFAYAPLAGTALMAAATVLIDQGLVRADKNEAAMQLETANGIERVEICLRGNVATRAKWLTNPPKVLEADVELAGNDAKAITVSLVSAGLPYLVVLMDDLGITLDNRKDLAAAAVKLSKEANSKLPTSRYGIEGNYDKYLIMAVSVGSHNHVRVAWISDKGEIANSAGGTGALSVIAALEARSNIPSGNVVTIEAPGGAFECQISQSTASVSSSVEITSRITNGSPFKQT